MTGRSVCVVTGSRSEYGLLKSSMQAIADNDDLVLKVVATGMHLLPEFGHTVDEIAADGFNVDRQVDMIPDGDTGLTFAKSLGLGIKGLAEAFADLNPDLVLVLGDRDEAFAAGVAAAHMNIPVGHIHGGDSMQGATIDDSIRHALTKFAHLHFPVSERSHQRILNLGEEPWRVTTVGAPGLDAIRKGDYTDPDSICEKLDIEQNSDLILVVQHPLTSEPEAADDQLMATLDAVMTIEDPVEVVLVYPNSDPGSQRMIEVIEEYQRERAIKTFRNLQRADYLGLMAASAVLVGNSSGGIIEAPSIGLPVVDVGPRQEGRERAANTVQTPHETEAIHEAVKRCLTNEIPRSKAKSEENPYDFGGAGVRIANRLAEVELDSRLLRKRLTY